MGSVQDSFLFPHRWTRIFLTEFYDFLAFPGMEYYQADLRKLKAANKAAKMVARQAVQKEKDVAKTAGMKAAIKPEKK